MRTTFHPYLPNGPTGDPAVWIDVQDGGHAVLLDAGELRGIPNRRLLRVDRLVVSHTHMDHFAGFDHLLRLALRREREIVLTGPAGFLDNVRNKLGGYTWNLIDRYPMRLRVQETDGRGLREVTYAASRGALEPGPESERPFDGRLADAETYAIEADVFDHGIPVLGCSLRERERLAVDKDRLEREGLQPGPWLTRLKAEVRAGRVDGCEIAALARDGSERTVPVAAVAESVLRRAPGQSLAYLTDLGYSTENIRKAVRLVHGVQLLICEAMFLHEDASLARERNHLTARQAGLLAREAGVQRLAPFHFSPRYEGREDAFFEEAAGAFGGPLARLPAC